MITLYGIKNCDTVKKARAWLAENHKDYQFHDYKVDGVTPQLIGQFVTAFGWEVLLNKRSTSWRQLSETQKTTLTADTVMPLLLAQPTLIKRPIVEFGTVWLIGFNPDEYQNKL